jgi:ketosteroid isomerase-like protein
MVFGAFHAHVNYLSSQFPGSLPAACDKSQFRCPGQIATVPPQHSPQGQAQMTNPQALIDRHRIRNVLALHSRGVDRGDANLLGATYHPGASVDYGFFVGPAQDLVVILAAAQKAAAPTLHRTSNCEIRVNGDRAVSESYVTAYVDTAATQRLVFGRYLDRHERRSGEWRLSHRRYVMDGNTNRASTASHSDPPVAHDNFVPEGAKGASDPGRALLAHYLAANRSLQGARPMSADAQELDAALSRDAIRALLTGYCRGIDRGDKALLTSIYWEDSTVVSGMVNASGAQFASDTVDFVTANLDYCFHAIANEWIEVKGDHAVGEHYVTAQVSVGGQDVTTGGRYIDSYQRRGGVWKIAARTFVADWNTSHPNSLELDGMYEPLKTRGSFGKGDPVYALWASL